jgi:hypothetical protein
MNAFRSRGVRLVSAAALGVGILVAPAMAVPPGEIHEAACPPGEVPNPAGYGCVPAMPFVGAPTQQELTACHGGNLYFCVDPYPVP